MKRTGCAWRGFGGLECGPKAVAVVGWDGSSGAPCCRAHLDRLCGLSDALASEVDMPDLITGLVLL